MQRVPLVLVINIECSDVQGILVEKQALTECQAFLTARSSYTQVYYTDSQKKILLKVLNTDCTV